MEYTEKIEKTEEAYLPRVIFDDYKPDDLYYAPGPGLEFTYRIVDKDGNNVPDPWVAADIEAFRARSYEDNGEYYWMYETYKVPHEFTKDENMRIPENSEHYWNRWASSFAEITYPQSYLKKYNIELNSFTRLIESENSGEGGILVKGEINHNFNAYRNIYDPETREWKEGLYGNNKIDNYDTLSAYVNDTLIYEEELSIDSLYHYNKIETSKARPNYVFNPHLVEPNKFEFIIPEEEAFDQIVLEFASVSPPRQDMTIYNGDNIYESAPQSSVYVISADQPSTYNIDFMFDQYISTVEIPYDFYMGIPLNSEVFTMTKLFENQYKYPTTTNDLIKLDYQRGVSQQPPVITDTIISAELDIPGVEPTSIEVKKRYEGNSVIFYVDENMYYDDESELVYIGKTEDGPINEKGLVLPWDTASKGTIKFTFHIDSFQEYEFNVELKVGNERPLRGNGGKYEIDGVEYEE